MPRLFFVSHTGRMSAGSSHSLLSLVKYLKDYCQIIVIMPDDRGLLAHLEHQRIPGQVAGIRRKYIPSLMWRFFYQRADVIYANNFSIQAYFALVAAKLVRKPFIWHIREIIIEKPIEPSVFSRMRYALRFADAIVANSTATAKSLAPYTKQKKIVTIFNGVELDDFKTDKNAAKRLIHNNLAIPFHHKIILNVGRISQAKNQLHAIEAVALLPDKVPDFSVCFIGNFHEPEYLARLKDRAVELDILHKIRFAGFKDQIGTYFRGADILLHTSQMESQGRVLLEAMASELPVITYDVGGIGESVIDQQTGFLISFGDTLGLAHALKLLLGNHTLRNQMGVNGRARVEANFTAERTAQQVEQVIETVLHRRL